MFGSEKRHIERMVVGEQGLGKGKANSGGPFINFLKLFFLVLPEISQGESSQKLWGYSEWFICPC